MIIFDKYGIKVYACELPKETPERGPHRLSTERIAVRQLLREAFPDDPSLTISHYSSGAPYLCRQSDDTTTPNNNDDNLPSISISHCKQMATIAIAPSSMRIGIDCENGKRAQTLRKVADRFLSPEQHKQWLDFPQSLWAWCIKEAAYKAALQPGLTLTDIPLPNKFPTDAPSTETSIKINDIDYNIIKINVAIEDISLILIFPA